MEGDFGLASSFLSGYGFSLATYASLTLPVAGMTAEERSAQYLGVQITF